MTIQKIGLELLRTLEENKGSVQLLPVYHYVYTIIPVQNYTNDNSRLYTLIFTSIPLY